MFSFVTRWFKKSEEKDEEVAVEKELPKGAPPPYSMDFEGADRIWISAVDCRFDNFDAIERAIVRPERIEAIVELLEDLPREGERHKEMNRCTEHTLTAYREGEPFARVIFYEGELKLEDGAFIAHNEKAHQIQKELFKRIEIESRQK